MLQIGPTVVTAGQKLVHHQARIDLLQLEQSRLAAEFAAGEEWDRDGFNSAYDWIRVNCHLPGNVTGNYLTVGAHLPQLGQSVEAVLKGEIGFAHLAVMARTADAVGAAFDENQLLPLAREHSAGKFHYKCLHYRHSVDAKAYAAEESEQMEFSLPIAAAAVQRMACDCSVTRVLLSQESVTIDVGRSKRVISGAARKALMARDGHCRWPGCERPASWCDGHHVVHWIDGGGTDLDNLVLLCR